MTPHHLGAPLLGHAGPVQPAELLGTWHLDPLVLGGLALTVWWYARGVRSLRRPVPRHRHVAFAVGILAVVGALVSPLEALAGSLASAHMVQHVLLVLVAAPALALAAPGVALLRGAPPVVRREVGRGRGAARLSTARVRQVWRPSVVWAAHVAVLWLWHAAALYGAALDSHVVHVAEHALFLVTALLFWGLVAGARGSTQVDRGHAILLVFTMALQGVLLSALMTFAGTPWYDGYASTTAVWGLTHLADQQLAGVIMWVPASLVHLGAVLVLFVQWMGPDEGGAPVGAARATAAAEPG